MSNDGYVIKVKSFEIILDDEKTYDLITLPKHARKKTRRKITVDESNSKPYAVISLDGKNLKIHHIICGQPLNSMMIDHLNGNSLDNRCGNLKVVTRHENMLNRPMKTKFKRWVTRQQYNGKFKSTVRIPLGSYDTEEEAHEVALKFMKTYFKDIYIRPDFLNAGKKNDK